jgi:hypothetical protein
MHPDLEEIPVFHSSRLMAPASGPEARLHGLDENHVPNEYSPKG